jgi:LCP family protein required for cell wall assembly
MNRVAVGRYSARSGWRSNPTKKSLVAKNDKPKVKKPRKKVKKTLVVLSVFLILGFCGFFFYNYANRIPGLNVPIIQPARSLCNDILDPKCWTDNFRPQLMQTNGYTNFLIIGMDTRDGDKGLLNTDTIALASLNHKTKEVMLLSIPRDFYSPKYVTRINAVYAFTKDRDKTDPYRFIKDEVSNITGQEIHYYATVRFDTFIEIIDEFNGIEVCPEDAFTAQYPNDNPRRGESQWVFYEFKKGCQTVNSERALVYARFRYVSKGPSSLASDFSRARRQQEVIEAVKDKALQDDMSVRERANRYWSIVQGVRQNVDTNVNFEDLLAGLGLVTSVSRDPINVVLDPSFGGIQ